MLANINLTQCVNLCIQDSTQDKSLMQICKRSSPFRTSIDVPKIRSWRTPNEWDRTSALGASTQQELRKNWLFQCRWVLWTLQHSVWCNVLFLSLLFSSRGETRSNWKRFSTWNKKEGTGRNAQTVYCGERLHCFRNVGMWMVETLRDWYVGKRTLESLSHTSFRWARTS